MRTLAAFLRKYSVAIIGLLCGLFGVGWSLYTEYVKRGEVTVSVISEGAVLDVRRDLPDLVVLFQAQDLRATDQSLRFYSFVVRNTGSANVTKNMFDDQIGWGLELRGANFVRVSDFTTTAPLLTPVLPTAAQPNRIRFNPAIFDSGDAFRFDVLVVHPKGQQPSIVLLGGISGTDYRLVQSGLELAPAYHEQVVTGGALVQVGRVVTYGLACLLLLVFLAAMVALVASTYDSVERRRWSRVELPAIIKKHKLDESSAKLLSAALRVGGTSAMYSMQALASDTLRIRRAAKSVVNDAVETETDRRLKEIEDRVRRASRALQGIDDEVERGLVSAIATLAGVPWEAWVDLQPEENLERFVDAVENVLALREGQRHRRVVQI